jgi:undecaprenyl phosphate-alpha-L-ara4FN deformylase
MQAATSAMEVAIKVDVDTHQGLKSGVPALARVLEEEHVSASFFVAMGPDNSGKAVRRVLRNRGFLGKMLRTRALTTYGWRTVLSGTLLPARPVALGFPNLLRELRQRGFEVGVHGYDHVRWHDEIDSLGEQGIRAELEDAFEAYRAIFGEPARSFAAPAWRDNALSLTLLDRMGLQYHSDTRGRTPFRCLVGGRVLATLEIPTTLPTFDEVLGTRGMRERHALVKFYLGLLRNDALSVHTIHAEIEGGRYLELFRELLRALKAQGASFLRLDAVARRTSLQSAPVCEVVRSMVAGRAGWVAMQGSESCATPPSHSEAAQFDLQSQHATESK